MSDKRNEADLDERERAEAKRMQDAGFTWDPAGSPRWTHRKLAITALRSPWMRDSDWKRLCLTKIAEAANLRLFDDLPLGTRFRAQRSVDSSRRVYVKLADYDIVEWCGADQDSRPPPHALSLGEAHNTFKIVELFEPFDRLLPGELEELPKSPGVWNALADWHACQAAQAEATDHIEPMKWHDRREKVCKEMAAALTDQLENG